MSLKVCVGLLAVLCVSQSVTGIWPWDDDDEDTVKVKDDAENKTDDEAGEASGDIILVDEETTTSTNFTSPTIDDTSPISTTPTTTSSLPTTTTTVTGTPPTESTTPDTTGAKTSTPRKPGVKYDPLPQVSNMVSVVKSFPGRSLRRRISYGDSDHNEIVSDDSRRLYTLRPIPYGNSLHRDATALQSRMTTCQDCMVRLDTVTSCPLHFDAVSLEAWLGQLYNLLSDGCPMGVGDRTRCCPSSDPHILGLVRDMTSRVRDVYHVLQTSCNKCPQDGRWSDWSSWTACQVTCGSGTRTRMRTCSNPAPANGGVMCGGRSRESSSCFPGPCCGPVDGSWTQWEAWSRCSVSCGDGTSQRIRTCRNPPPNACGKQCPGQDLQTQNCNLETCCVPLNGNWSPWAEWSACSKTCSGGSRQRTRACDSPPPNKCGCTCPGLDRQREDCNTGDCCVDGQWGSWLSWGSCSVTCGCGQLTRMRRCDSPAPTFCGLRCVGSTSESVDCCGENCCVEGGWCAWSAWGQCSVTCGEGVQNRTRTCQCPSHNSCGRPCAGSTTDLQRCRQEDCCVDGNWGSWEAWSQVTVTCGSGMRTRRRRCDSPPPDSCGRPCDGVRQERQLHDTRVACPPRCAWASWSMWSPCSLSCGARPGTRSRTRNCVRSGAQLCPLLGCPGSSREEGSCPVVPCLPPPAWTAWEEWCPCNCRRGVRSRRRSCSQLGQSLANVRCTGLAKQEEYCDVSQVRNCPDCITDCVGKANGTYPSCTSCSDYITCSRSQVTLNRCPSDWQWDDHKKKCVIPPSESCPLLQPMTSCQYGADGTFHASGGCGRYIECERGRRTDGVCRGNTEFDAHAMKCRAQRSRTCTRRLGRHRQSSARSAQRDASDENEDENDDTKKKEQMEKDKKQHATNSGRHHNAAQKADHSTEDNEALPRSQKTVSTQTHSKEDNKMEKNYDKSISTHSEKSSATLEKSKNTHTKTDLTRNKLKATHKKTDVTYEKSRTRNESSRSTDEKPSDADTKSTQPNERSKSNNEKSIPSHLKSSSAGTKSTLTDDKSSSTRDLDSDTNSVPLSRPIPAETEREVKLRNGKPAHQQKGHGNSRCYTRCEGLKKGKKYQSCQGCRFFLHCPLRAPPHVRRCQGNHVWDDTLKRCTRHSNTCGKTTLEEQGDNSHLERLPVS
ncbi:uncharacterized protein [Littorina saxatilis]|uniref:uncharacterized protein isoform X1 n=1 Tax=Littorina saxatilis TaxID=31220 RepID=UPI0038B54CAB